MTVLHLRTCTTRKQKTKTCSSIFIIITKNKLNPRNKERKKVKAAIEFFSFIALLLLWKTKKQVQSRTEVSIIFPTPNPFFTELVHSFSLDCVLFDVCLCLVAYIIKKAWEKKVKDLLFFFSFFFFFFFFGFLGTKPLVMKFFLESLLMGCV